MGQRTPDRVVNELDKEMWRRLNHSCKLAYCTLSIIDSIPRYEIS
jgi:hypothetical protein